MGACLCPQFERAIRRKIAYSVDTMIATDPFSVLTFVAAPAVLTNASSVLALGTNNRLARVADRTHAVSAQLAGGKDHGDSATEFTELQARAQLLLRALRCFY